MPLQGEIPHHFLLGRRESVRYLVRDESNSQRISRMAESEYEIGGPLAGLKLPLFSTQHGEEPGFPGCLPGTKYSSQNQYPEYELYPGSVEHWRTNMARMHPNRTLYDRQSQIRNWVAPEIPGVRNEQIDEYAAPVYWNQEWILQYFVAPDIPNEPGPKRDEGADKSLACLADNTGKKLGPVPVIRMRAGEPGLVLDLGELAVGLYVVRLIGVVATEDIHPFRKPLFLEAEINDQPGGQCSLYNQRLGYCDEFYDVADIYFRAEEQRSYELSLRLGEGSEVDLLLHNISLDDVLAGTVRRPLKERTLHPGGPKLSKAVGNKTRSDRDREVWHGFPALNFQAGHFDAGGPNGIPGVEPGTGGMTREEIENQFGVWKHSEDLSLLMVNEKLGLRYSMEDFCHRRPLPEPYPFQDEGAGLIFPSGQSSNRGRVWAPIGGALIRRIGNYYRDFQAAADAFHENGDTTNAHEGALKLIRFAYSFPTLEDNNMLTCVVHNPGSYGRADRCRRRETGGAQFLGHFAFHFTLAPIYDKFFSFIQNNEELAESVGRFIPWVETSQDVIELLDTYLLQMLAKRFMRYHYTGDGREPEYLAEIAAIIGDAEVAQPMMEWLFHRTFYYPRPLAGIPDYMVTATDRDGRGTIASSSYVFGDSWTAKMAEGVDVYVKNGGNPKYDLHDLKRFPKILSSLYFPIRSRTAGMWTMRMGNVSGPDKDYQKGFQYLWDERAASGWRWTHDPAFAFALFHYGSREGWSDEEWNEIEEASKSIRRAPWMENRSRVLPGYAAFLESGLQHDDSRFRRSVMLRVGTGTGHAHNDTLDLQIHAHGVPMTMNAGQRPGYSTPGDKHTRVHNTVEVDGTDWMSIHTAEVNQWDHLGGTNSWISTMADGDGTRYMRAIVASNPLCKTAQRQVMLIDVDEGEGSQELGPKCWGPKPEGLPENIVTPNSYVVDVFRVSGGSTHTYCFHSHIADPDPDNPQPRTNLEGIQRLSDHPIQGIPNISGDLAIAAEYLTEFSGERYFARAPLNLEATFALQKDRKCTGSGSRFQLAGTESYLLGCAYSPALPDKFTRLHMPGVKNQLVMRGDLNCTQWDYRIPNIFVQRHGHNLESAFVAVIEPFAGKPFIESVERLQIDDSDTSAKQPIAVRVVTTNGQVDICYASECPEKLSEFGDIKVAAETAFYSVDENGLNRLSLVGAAEFESPQIRIKVPRPERRGRIIKVDHSQQSIWIDQVWPASEREQLVEVITQPADDPKAWKTGFTVTSIQPEQNCTRITFLRSAGNYRSQILDVNPDLHEVTAGLHLPEGCGDFCRGWTATNEAGDRLWRVKSVIDCTFTLDGGPLSRELFQPENVLRLWEYGLGDEIRQSVHIGLVRLPSGAFELRGEAGIEIQFAGHERRDISAEELSGKGASLKIVPVALE